MKKYRFGLGTADYLICGECGVYTAAIAGEDDARAIVIINALDDQRSFSQEPIPVDYDAESKAQRQARRRLRWMPVEMRLANDRLAVEAPARGPRDTETTSIISRGLRAGTRVIGS
ncbi:hypothetical protein [Mesorhizobium sp. BR1-1-14]|uniref:hypothetical protein n=1 Tax=Mesorhizobium sp. BR1-1-14 TaxID=2876655 RepID=UPI001CD0D0A6|nr:hypothetical protein [Mesorhizobium sp. BR1-1-14]MBZ9957350.1 hypothetical protein [Mesorhizobium sp. BR1-1-14]